MSTNAELRPTAADLFAFAHAVLHATATTHTPHATLGAPLAAPADFVTDRANETLLSNAPEVPNDQR